MNNKDILHLIRINDPQTFKQLYQDVYPSSERMILKNHGTPQDADDIFQEALLILIEKARMKDFVLKVNINGYLYGIVRNLWLKKLQKEKKNKIDLVLDEEMGSELKKLGSNDPAIEDLTDRPKLVVNSRAHKAISALSPECKELLLDFYGMKTSLGELAEERNLSKSYIKQKKFRCMQRLRKLYTLQNASS